MAKRKKSKKTSKRRGGLRGLRSGNTGKKIGLFFASVIAAGATDEALGFAKSQEFMQQSDPNAKMNIKAVGLSAGVLAAAAGLSALSGNEIVDALAKGAGSAAFIHAKDEVKPAIGMGSVEDYLDLYKNTDSVPLEGNARELELAG